MYRRKLLVGSLLAFSVPGCLGAPSTAGDDPGRNHELQQAYVIRLEPLADSVDEDEDVCEFAELTDAAQREIEQAIEQEEYRVKETPELIMRDCHNGYVEYEGAYYWLRITIESG